MDDEKQIYIVHHDISKNLAQSLGVQSQTKQLLKADSFGFEAYGQNEPLTQRIKNILDEYPDNMGIFKEMIQNADDAGASEVAFVIDHRTNNNQLGLFDPGMAACHGSALWSYNNSVFTDNDFANIQKLGGQTKKDIVEKIGRFGLGFNSVYHLTDVPSFVSGPFVAIFDPYTTHLNDIINDKTKPGVKINFVNNKHLQNICPDQFKPYQDLFGCKISTSPEPFDGTLFRLPFRQEVQTVDHIQQMSRKTYADKSRIDDLIKELVACPDVLLLFAQNVTKVTLFEIPRNETNGIEDMKQILEIEKKPLKYFKLIDSPGVPIENAKNPLSEQTNILSHAKIALDQESSSEIISSILFEISIKKTKTDMLKSTKWLVTNAVGNSEALEFARNDEGKEQGLMPCGGVAICLLDKENTLIPKPVKGQIFCFLPLSIPTDLPVHVNGAFSVASNRKNLWRVSQDSRHNWRGEWNQKLMADAVSLAYMSAIQHITRLLDQKLNNKMIDEWTKSFSSIFPLARGEKTSYDEVDHLTFSFYKKVEKAKAKILPVMSRIDEKLKIQWFQPTSEDLETKAFFGERLPSCKEEKRANVRDILIDLGFNQIHQSFDSLGPSFRNTGVNVEQTKPSIVIRFLKNCRLKQSLPKKLQETEMLNLERVTNLMTYCLSEKVIIKIEELTLSKKVTNQKTEEVSLVGLPLLLTKDNILRVFDGPVFESTFCNLVPAQHCRFLNGALQHLFSNHSVFGKKLELSDLQTMEQYIKDEMKNPKWILLFWKFLSEKMVTEKNVKLLPEQVTAMIPNWEVIPARRGNYPKQENKMMPFKSAKKIIIVSKADMRNDNFLSILRKLHCWELDFESLEKFQKVPQYLKTYHSSTYPSTLAFTDLASKFTSSLEDYNGLCEVLRSLDIPLGYLTSEESKTLLEYFEHEAQKLKPQSLELLKKLPVFETIFGEHVPVSQLHIRVLGWNIPVEGLNVWLPGSGSIFLKHHSTLAELYEKMGFKEITVMELYQQYIFHWLQNMDDVSLMVHLKKLMEVIPFWDTKKATAALAPLKSYNLIGPYGFRRRVSEFFDPKKSDFKKLLPPHLLLPDEYNEIIPLLKFIGLNSKLTQDALIEIANDIEIHGPSPPDANNIRGMLLVQHLYDILWNLHQSNKLHYSSLCEIASIKFIDAHKVPSALSKLHPQFSQNQLICFAEATTYNHENKTWTCSNLLPSWAKPSYKEIANFLKIFLEPPTEKVVEHCKNLCSSLSDRKKLETTEKQNSEDLCSKLSEVMKDNYRFLSKHADEPIVKELSKINCILVENGKKLIMPSKVVMEMSDDLRPYLYKFPLEMGEFQALFRALGTTKKPTLNQLSIVLASIHRDSRGEPLSPEERRIASKAISSFFPSFKEQGSESCNEIQTLYLLSKKDVLLNSNQMMFNDEPKFTGRLSNTSNEWEEPGHLMLDLKLLKQLPVQLRPKFLSDEVHEKLCTEATDICPSQSSSCKLKNEIEKLISDHFFQEGLKRIFWHVCIKADKEFSDDVMMKALEKICEIQLECRPRIESELIHTINGQVVPESKKDLRYFVDEDKILTHHDDGDRFKIAEIISTKIVDIFKDYNLIECQQIILHILDNEDPTNIPKILEEESIEHLNAQHENKNQSGTLTLGQVIEDHLKHLLLQNPSHYFKTEELVGFEKDGVCILAKVLLELDEDEFQQRSNMLRKYLIDVGSSETVAASALDLYKFVRRNEDEVDSKDEIKIESFDVEDEIPSSEDSSFEVELYPGNEDSRTKTNSSQFDEAAKDEKKPKFDDLPLTIEMAKDEIDEMLTEAWKLPEAEKNKAIKRLYLRWHPDKNPGKDALCTEAFKYLMNQLEHMKKTGSLNKDRSNASTESSSRSYDNPFWSYYGDFFKKWDSEAKQQGRQRNRHRQGREYGFGARGNQPKSNPNEARRWMKQAKSDLANAKQALNEFTHDLTCFNAQQASEKALKALLLFIDGDLQSSHQLIYLAKRVEMRCPTKHQRFIRGIVDLAKQLSSIGQSGGDSDNLYDRSKCPSAHNSSQIPATAFQRENAEIAIKLAEEIVQKASEIIF